MPVLAGCRGGTSLDRLPVHGTLTVVGGDKLNGSITFLPAGGRGGPAATTGIVDGSYQFDRQNGPTSGRQDVLVKRIVPRGETLKSLSEKKPARPVKSEWTRSADIADDGQYVQDFALD